MTALLEKGYWMCRTPRGYNPVKIKDEAKIPTINKEGEILRNAFYWRLDGLSDSEIRKRLKCLGVDFSFQQLHKMFSNIFYAGKISHSLLKGRVLDGKHEPLVPIEIFLRASGMNNIKGERSDDSFNKFPLKRIVKCGACGTGLTGYPQRKNGKVYGYYKCNKQGCRCNNPATLMHSKFVQFLHDYEIDERLIAPFKRILKGAFKRLNENNNRLRTEFTQQLGEIETKIQTATENYLTMCNDKNSVVKPEAYKSIIEKMEKEKMLINEQLEHLANELSNSDGYLDYALKVCSNLAEI